MENFKHTFTASNEVYANFLTGFNDHNPLHVDEGFAKGKGFEGKVMHGNILNGFLSYMIGEKLPTKDVIIHQQSIKFHNPFYLNDELNCELNLEKYVESVNTYIYKFSFVRKDTKIASGKIQIGII